MKVRNYQIARLIGKMRKDELNVEILKGWEHFSLKGALGACEIATSLYGGEWVVIMETPKTVQVWVSKERFERWTAWYNRETKQKQADRMFEDYCQTCTTKQTHKSRKA